MWRSRVWVVKVGVCMHGLAMDLSSVGASTIDA